jgi:hypothetical protein
MSIRNQRSSGRGEILLSRIVLMIATVTLVALWYVFPGFGSLEARLLLGLLSLALVGSLVGFSRVRYRARWKAAWDAYAAQEGSRDSIGPYQEQRTLSMAGTR